MPVRHSSNGSKPNRSRASSLAENRLSIIDEDYVAPPPMPEKPSRTFSRGWAFGNPPRHSFEDRPPKYTLWDVMGPKGESFNDVRNNKYIAQRGGWRRICLIFFLVLGVLIALIVGLAVGLTKKLHHNPPPPSETSALPTTSNPAFPAGSYALNTYLLNVTTDCVANDTDWACVPYHTYSQSPSQSKATFDWIVYDNSPDSVPADQRKFTISSSSNPFSITFPNVTLELVDKGRMTERYTFEARVDKIVVPTDALNVNCYYNDTMFTANLYTHLKQVVAGQSLSTIPAPTGTAAAEPTGGAYSAGFQNWPYAVEVTQSFSGGADVPECYQMMDGQKGPRVNRGVGEKSPVDQCTCYYKSFDVSS